MSFEVTTAFVEDFKSTVQLLLQQSGSRFRPTVTEDMYEGKGAKSTEQIGSVTAQKRTSRHSDTPLISTPHDARWVYPVDYEWADLIDDQDKLRMIIDPQSPYAVNGANAMGRAMDDEIIRAFDADAKTGQDGGTTTSFDTNNEVSSGSTGMTVSKLREAKRILMANEVDVDNDRLHCALSAEQHEDLLGDTQAVSLDFTNRPALVDGRITSFMGFNFTPSERLPKSGSDRYNFYWAESGMHLGVWKDMVTRISERSDKSHATQVYLCETVGATRLEEGKVGRILSQE